MVATVRGRRKAKQKAWREVLEQAPVHWCSGVVEFIDDEVIKMRCDELLQMLDAAQGLDRSAEDVDFAVALATGIKTDAGLRADAQEGCCCLRQNFLTMGNKQDASGLRLPGIESR